jgi:hypothetical protein
MVDDGAQNEYVGVSLDANQDLDPHPASTLSPRDEIGELIGMNEGRLGDVYRLGLEGLEPAEIAERLNVATPNFVYTYRYQIDAALDGKPTSGSVLRRQALSALNSLMKRGRNVLSPEAHKLLQSNAAAVEAAGLVEDPAEAARADIDEAISAAETLEDLRGERGIYAFSYGWYLESPIDPEGGRTLIKVGRAEDVETRIRQHTSGARTHIPEPLALVRVYSARNRDLAEIERNFHDLLESAGHANPRRNGKSRSEVGKEWFLTNENFLDTVAKVMGLTTLYIGQSEFVD